MLDSYFFLRDERDLILTALSLAQTGKDLYGNVFPLIFSRISPQAPLLGMYWVVPIISLLHISSPIVVKMLYLLPTLFFPVLAFELIKSITKEDKISFLTAFVVSFSPWYFHIARLGIEAHLAYFFCLLGLIMYLYEKKCVGLIFLVLSYFSYFGIRPFILIVVPYIELWHYFFNFKKDWKKTAISLVIFIVLFGSVFLLSSRIEQTAARSSAEVIFLNRDKLTLDTNFLRAISDAPFFMRKFFDNKIYIVLNTIFNNFFKGIDFSYLFSTGDYVSIYANQIMGQFFPFLCVFLTFGICYLAKKKRSGYYFIASLSLVGLVSSLINSYSLTFSVRSVLSLIGIGFICALGIVYVYELCNKRWKLPFIMSVIFLYSFFSGIFIYKYLFQNYKLMNEAFNEQERFMANYSTDQNIQKMIVSNIHSYFLSYLSTIPSLSPKIFLQVQEELNKSDGYLLNGHNFLQCNAGRINIVRIDKFPISTLIEETCLSAKTKIFIEINKPKNVIKLLNPQYNKGDVNRGVKYYFFK